MIEFGLVIFIFGEKEQGHVNINIGIHVGLVLL